jgi:hypothetical protein
MMVIFGGCCFHNIISLLISRNRAFDELKSINYFQMLMHAGRLGAHEWASPGFPQAHVVSC